MDAYEISEIARILETELNGNTLPISPAPLKPKALDIEALTKHANLEEPAPVAGMVHSELNGRYSYDHSFCNADTGECSAFRYDIEKEDKYPCKAYDRAYHQHWYKHRQWINDGPDQSIDNLPTSPMSLTSDSCSNSTGDDSSWSSNSPLTPRRLRLPRQEWCSDLNCNGLATICTPFSDSFYEFLFIFHSDFDPALCGDRDVKDCPFGICGNIYFWPE